MLRARVELDRKLCKEYFATCFWHWQRDMRITVAMISSVVKEL